jgi:hypothetical protein
MAFKTLVADITTPPELLRKKITRRTRYKRRTAALKNLSILDLSRSRNYATLELSSICKYFTGLATLNRAGAHHICALKSGLHHYSAFYAL